MSETGPNPPPPDRAGGGDGDGEDKKAQLEALFAAWDERGRAEGVVAAEPEADDELRRARRAWGFDPLRLWLTLTLLGGALCVWLMASTRYEVAYWLQGDTAPVELGDLGERYKAGERKLPVESNRYVHASGLFITHESEGMVGRGDGDGDATRRFFLCPLFDIVVRTSQPFPDKPFHRAASIEVDAAWIDLLEQKRAFPYDLTITTEVTGRLVRGSEVSRWHAKPVVHFAQVARRDPRELWLLIDGDRPENYAHFAGLWGAAVLALLASFGLLARAFIRRRRGA
jgi:hypothetical protein